MYGKSFSTLGRLLEPITQDSCAFYDDHVLFDDYTGVVLETDEGDRIAEALERISPNIDKKIDLSKSDGFVYDDSLKTLNQLIKLVEFQFNF